MAKAKVEKLKSEYRMIFKKPHEEQERFLRSKAKRKVIKAGRRGGKTVGIAIMAEEYFYEGKRVLYGAPTSEQVDSFWTEVCLAFEELIDGGLIKKNESEHFLELTPLGMLIFEKKMPGITREQLKAMRIKAKTCWNANTLRGDNAWLLILDEFQLMSEDTWDEVGAPMLMDNNGDAVFIYTPPSLYSTQVSKARDPRHASKMFKKALSDTTGVWEAFHFTSWDNPYISKEALNGICNDMSLDAYRREIMAEDDEIEESWLVYGVFDDKKCVIPSMHIPDNWFLYSGHDFGQANPAALFIACDPATGFFYIFDEYLPGGGSSAYQHIEQFKRITKGRKTVRSVGGNRTTEDDSRALYSEHGWEIFPPKFPRINAQIDRVKGLMILNKIYIFENCVHLLSELSNCLWDIDNTGLPTDKIKNEAKFHLLASLRYIFSDFTPETVKYNKPKVTGGW